MPFADIRQTASIAEIAWTAIGIVALIVNLGLTWNARGDYAALTRLGQNGGRKIAARTALVIQAGLTAPQVVAVAIGVLALLSPPTNGATPTTRTTLILTIGLILNELILVWVALYTHLRRRLLLGYLDKQEDTAGAARHEEAMTELLHNTEVSTEARDGALESFHAANNLNIKIAETNRVAGEASAAAMESTDKLYDLMERLEGERKDRED